jgi:hypothetical protein
LPQVVRSRGAFFLLPRQPLLRAHPALLAQPAQQGLVWALRWVVVRALAWVRLQAAQDWGAP